MIRIAVGIVTLMLVPLLSLAQSSGWPSRPIRVIVPFAAGGPSDVVARLLAPRVSERLGQPVVVENQPGGSANIGTEAVAKAPGDGYTVLFASTYIVVNPTLFRNLRYDAQKDFTPVAIADVKPMVLVSSPGFAPNTLKELIAAAKERPGGINFASPGSGTLPHLAGELLNSLAGIKLVHVPYKGIPPAQADVMGGRVEILFDALASALRHIRAGKLKAIVVPYHSRYPVLPDAPTVVEAGMPGLEMVAWDGYFLPSGTPIDIVDRLHAAVAAATGHAETAQRMTSLGIIISRETREQFAARVRDETRKWGEVVRISGARAD